MKTVQVTWLDACSRLTDGRWSNLEDVEELSPLKATSVGFLVKDAPDYLVIASHMGETNAGGEICIPRACIVSIVELREKDHA